jgi:hypothetical protein
MRVHAVLRRFARPAGPACAAGLGCLSGLPCTVLFQWAKSRPVTIQWVFFFSEFIIYFKFQKIFQIS